MGFRVFDNETECRDAFNAALKELGECVIVYQERINNDCMKQQLNITKLLTKNYKNNKNNKNK
jgi:hypothetical protein